MSIKERFFSYLESGGSFAFSIDGVSYCIDAFGFSKQIDGEWHTFRYSICPFNIDESLTIGGEYNTAEELLEYKLVNGNQLKNHIEEIYDMYQIVYA